MDVGDGVHTRVLEANQAALDLLKTRKEDLKSLMPEKFVIGEMKARRETFFKEVLEKGRGSIELQMKIREDKVRWLEITAHAFRRTGANMVVGVAKDITETKKTTASLRETEKLYRTLFESAQDAIGLFSVEREMLLFNTAFHENLGYDREELMKMPVSGIIHPDDKEMLLNLQPRLMQEGELSVDFRIIHKSGKCMYVSSKTVLIPGEEGKKDLILTIIRDITERKEHLDALERARDRAEESDRLKSSFLANMSHEIRTPMNSIVGFSTLLDNASLDEKTREMYVDRIIRNSELLLALITDIIDLAKIESGQLAIIYGKLLISDLMHDMEQYAHDELERLGKKDIIIRTEVACDDFEIEVDVLRIAQVMKNLINNAVKFTKKGEVRIGCKRVNGDQKILLYVEDEGIGIAHENFDLIFDQFRQIDGSNTRKHGGTGLGLAISRNLVKMMGGRIWVESNPGKGALFQVELPVRFSAVTPAPEEQVTPEELVSFDPGQKLVMVVDDEQDTLDLFHAMLTTLGYQVAIAGTGYEALRILEQSVTPDLILMDIQMPVMSGTDTLRIIRRRFPGISVVAQSAHALLGDRDRFLGEGYDDYLAKPFTSAQLNSVISRLIGT